MAIYRIGTDQPGGVHHHILPGTTQFSVGQQGTNTMDPYMDAYEAFIGVDQEVQIIGLPNNLSAPTSVINNLGTSHKRFTVFTAPMVPYVSSSGSLDRFINSTTYDSQHHTSANAIVAAGFGRDSSVRGGHEANGQPSNPGHFPWSVGFVDPYTGLRITPGQYMTAAAKMEGIWRAEGYLGYFEWNIGTGDTSASAPSAIMPTHGDPRLTLLGWDWYARIGWNGTKNDVAAAFAQDQAQDEMYMSYCRSHGILQAHSEFGQTCRTDSPYAPNDGTYWTPAFYDHAAANADVKAYLGQYLQNQFSGSVVQEGHLCAVCVATSGGSPAGVPATAKYTGSYPPRMGTPGPNAFGPAPTLAEMGSIQHASNTGLHWVWNPDPNKQGAISSWRASFGDIGAANGKGTAGLTIAITPPVVPPTHTVLRSGRKVRRQFVRYR